MSRVPVREAVAVIVALAFVGVGFQAWQTARSGWQSLRASPPPHETRELGGVLDGQLDGALTKAARIIPRDAVFSVEVGDDPPAAPAVVEAVPGVFRYWLLPRRYTPNLHDAEWIVTFHHSSETMGVPIRREIGLAPYSNLVEVGR